MHTSIWFSGRGISSDFHKQCRTVCGWTPKLIDCCVSDSPSSTTALKSLMLLPNLILKKSSIRLQMSSTKSMCQTGLNLERGKNKCTFKQMCSNIEKAGN